MMQNGDTFDLRHALAATSWHGDLASIGNFVKVAANGNTGIVSINPTGFARRRRATRWPSWRDPAR